MKPMKGAPPLFRLNGCGTSMLGRRAYDAETGTYVKTLVITLLFIPVLPITSYRVADAQDGGWYFIGKERISPQVRMIRSTLLLLALFAVLGVFSYARHHSPDATARRAIAAAEAAAAAGDHLDAANKAQMAAGISTDYQARALELADQYLDAAFSSADPRDILRAFDLARDSRYWRIRFQKRSDDLEQQMIRMAGEWLEADPSMALEFAFRARKVDRGDAAWVAPMRAALEALVASGDAGRREIDSLATLYSDLGENNALIRLLEPRAPFDDEPTWAGLLGRAYLREGRAMEAVPVLEAHIERYYPVWVSLQASMEKAWQAAYDAALASLNEGRAPQSFYDAYERAAEEAGDQMVNQYLRNAIDANARVKSLNAELEKTGNVSALMMDLGIACIEAGHAAEPDDRDIWFGKAEKTFLRLRAHAEDSPDFQFFYGQVCYWLGKSREGAELFDRLLKDHSDDAGLLIEMGVILRGVGKWDKAREVYRKALDATEDPELRASCIVPLAILAKTVDERIEVLESGDVTIPRIAIDLAEARAAKALEEGDRAAALALYREALAGYGRMQENSTTLNNAALLHFSIFEQSGDQTEHAEGLRKLEAAVALEPNDSILNHNTATRLLTSACAGLLSEALGADWMPLSRGIDDLRLLYVDEAGREEVVSRFTSHPHYVRGRAFLERALVLAPENRSLLMEAVQLATFTRDTALAANLRNRLRAASETAEIPPIDEWITEVEDVAEVRDTIAEQMKVTADWYENARSRVQGSRARLVLDLREATGLLHQVFWLPDLDAGAAKAAVMAVHEQWPSSESSHAVSACESLFAWREICLEQPAIAEWAGDSLRMLHARELLMLAAIRFDNVLENAATRRAFSSMLEQTGRFPSWHSSSDAVLAELMRTEDRDAILVSARSHPTADLHEMLSTVLAPHAPGTAVQQLLRHWITEGREAAIGKHNAIAAANPWLPEL